MTCLAVCFVRQLMSDISWDICCCFFNLSLSKIIIMNIWGFPAEEEGAELHADSGGAVEEERPRERSSFQEKGGKFRTLIQTCSSHLTEN